jgi:CRISPR-associated protein Cas1
MITVYITRPGVKIYKEGNTLKVKKGDTIYHTIFPFRTEQVIAFSNVEMTWSAMLALLKNRITTVFLNKNGHYNGKLVPPYDSNVLLRRMQYKCLDDKEKCFIFTKEIVKAKLKNQLTMLKRISRFQKKNLSKTQSEIERLLSDVEYARDIPSLRGYEGAGARAYFSVFDHGFIRSQGFRKRIRRPPTDPVNAVLSLLYTLLFTRIDSVIEKESLDPYVGVFHALGYGRRSLTLDIMEEFRTIIADTLVFSLFNMNIIDVHDFRRITEKDSEYEEFLPPQEKQYPDILKDKMGSFSDVPSEYETSPVTSLEDDGHESHKGDGYPVILSEDALKKVIAQFERKLETSFTYPIENKKMTYREAITKQVKQYATFLRGEREKYRPLVML